MSPRISLWRPSQAAVRRFLAVQRQCDVTYETIGCTQQEVPRGFDCDHNRRQLGVGLSVFQRASEALASWQMFPAAWTEVAGGERGMQPGETVGVLVRACGLWWLNAARIVYVIDVPQRRFGFAYGTLPGHVECGEERFLVERDEDDRVWYDLKAISRPRLWLAQCAYPLVRRQQRRFGLDSMETMWQTVQSRPSSAAW